MPKGKDKSGRLSVFKGREARLNRAIFHTLAHRGPLTIYDIYKEVKAQKNLRETKYASVSKRVRLLVKSGYTKRIGTKKTKAGFEVPTYDLQLKAYLAVLFDSVRLETLLTQITDESALEILTSFIGARTIHLKEDGGRL